MDYKKKADKYKRKYLNLKQHGGLFTCDYYDDSYYMFSNFDQIDKFLKYIYDSNPEKYKNTLLNLENQNNYKNYNFIPKNNEINLFEKYNVDITEFIKKYEANKVKLLATIINSKVVNSINNAIIKKKELGYDSNSNIWMDLTRIINYLLCVKNNSHSFIPLIRNIIENIITEINKFMPFKKDETAITIYENYKKKNSISIKINNSVNDYSKFTIKDYFNKEKNKSFIIPPSLLLLLTLDISYLEILKELIETGVIKGTVPDDFKLLINSFKTNQIEPIVVSVKPTPIVVSVKPVPPVKPVVPVKPVPPVKPNELSINQQKKIAKKELKEKILQEVKSSSESSTTSSTKKEQKQLANEILRKKQEADREKVKKEREEKKVISPPSKPASSQKSIIPSFFSTPPSSPKASSKSVVSSLFSSSTPKNSSSFSVVPSLFSSSKSKKK